MADSKISALTTDTNPDRTADYLPTYDASAVGNKKVLLSNVGPIVYRTFMTLQVSPADASTYTLSGIPGFGLVTNFAAHKTYILRSGLITAVRLFGICTTGSAENSTIAFRLNDTTDTTITSTLAMNASPFTVINTSLSIAVTGPNTDYFGIKWTTPTWVTNPTSVSFYVDVYQT